ncbi:MAG: 4-hydroxybutyrate dehydrogenase [Clostridiales bacterium]|nr:4-hydroxybutyrate dehydrogenase [Clostridiales bacterium]
MKEFSVSPKIFMLKDCNEFIKEFKIDENDLVITIEVTWNTYFKDIKVGTVIYIENYGVGEPSDEMIEAAAADIKKPYNRVIAIGGGTVIDCAKLFALKNLLPVTDLFDKKIPAEKEKELVLVPTTCGTGSEVTNISILEFKRRHTKFGLADKALFGDYAVIVPELLYKLPFKVFAASSIDALVHSAESYLSPKATEISKMFSVKAMTMILNGYKKIEKEGREVLKSLLPDFCLASTLAGIAFGNAGCAAVHAMSYPLGAEFHVPHGESNYAMFTGVFKKYMEIKPEGDIRELNKIIADILGCEVSSVSDSLEALLNGSILKKKSLSEYGMRDNQIEEFTDSVIANQQRLLNNNYVFLDRNTLIEIYTKLM